MVSEGLAKPKSMASWALLATLAMAMVENTGCRKLNTSPGVADCAVFGIPDEEFGESVMAVVQPMPGATLDADSLRAELRRSLAGFKVPRRIDFADDLPREDSGKIFKRKLRAPFWEGRDSKI